MTGEGHDERLVCRECYGQRIRWLAWANPNTNAVVFTGDAPDPFEPGKGASWCEDCDGDMGIVGVGFWHSRECRVPAGCKCEREAIDSAKSGALRRAKAKRPNAREVDARIVRIHTRTENTEARHYCAGASCFGFAYRADRLAHPPSCAREPGL